MLWGYNTGGGTIPSPVKLSVESHPHALITGGSGSGKSYALQYLIGCILQDISISDFYICDFKNSHDFEFLENYEHFYVNTGCFDGIMSYYDRFTQKRQNKRQRGRSLLIIDEYPAFISYLSSIDKLQKTKKASEITNAIAEILMLGRGINCGVWIVTQRADASLFANGARDNFQVILGLGRMSREQKGMVFTGEEIPDRIYRQGEGLLLADGHPLYEIKIPKITNLINWRKHILLSLQK